MFAWNTISYMHETIDALCSGELITHVYDILFIPIDLQLNEIIYGMNSKFHLLFLAHGR